MKEVIFGAEQFVVAITWTALYQRMFPQVKSKVWLWGSIHVLLTGLAACLCGQFINRQIIPVFSIGLSSGFNIMFTKRHSSMVVVESLVTYVVIKALWLVSIWSSFFLLILFDPAKHPLMGAIGTSIIHIFLCFITMKRINIPTWKRYAEKYSLIIVSASSILFVISYAVTSITYTKERREFNMFSLAVIIASFVILIAWTLSDIQHAKEEEKQKERIDTLLRSAHKYKEIIPAVERELIDMQRKINADSDHDWAPELGIAIEEISNLRKASASISARELSGSPNFATTGLALLDSQLQAEQEAAAQSGSVFDCTVMTPATGLIERGLVSQFQLQQIVGDLYRNARKAIQDSGKEGGRLLLILGDTRDGYQIKMCDSGRAFPEEVLSRLGERGVTTGGTGHGLADILEVLAGCGASLEIKEYPEGARFTKSVSILFDGKAEVRV